MDSENVTAGEYRKLPVPLEWLGPKPLKAGEEKFCKVCGGSINSNAIVTISTDSGDPFCRCGKKALAKIAELEAVIAATPTVDEVCKVAWASVNREMRNANRFGLVDRLELDIHRCFASAAEGDS